MFTGIIAGVGRVVAIRRASSDLAIDVDVAGVVPDPVIGESVALDGVCLTVISAKGSVLSFDVSAETIARSTFKNVREGGGVNVERAMRLGDRVGGHLVSGHVDAVGRISRIDPSGQGYEIEVELAPDGMKYIIEKGSIALSGMSLTVARKLARSVTVAVIPHTWSLTTLSSMRPGSELNVEYDMMAKYVENFVKPAGSGVGEDLLRRTGFI